MVTSLNFKTRFPEFTSETDERVEFFITDAYLEVDTSWGTLQDIGVSYLTAHLLALSNKSLTSSSSIGQVASKSVEGVSISYATNANDSTYLSSTSYGQRYLQLKKRVKVGMVKLV